MRKITYCLVDDTQLPLLFTLGAEMQIAERLGSLDALFDVFAGEEDEAEQAVRAEIEKGMNTQQRARRDAEKAEGGTSLMAVLPFTIAVLARQGQLYLGDKPTITEDWVRLHALPADIEPMTLAMCKAISGGLDTRHSLKNEDVDLVAESLQKN